MRRLFTIAAVVLAAGSVIFARSGMQAPGQEPEAEKKLIDLKSDNMGPIAPGDSVIFLVGNFAAQHNGAVITCDSAVRYSDMRIEFFGNVLINKNTTYIYGDRAEYNGELNEARVYSDIVKVVDEGEYRPVRRRRRTDKPGQPARIGARLLLCQHQRPHLRRPRRDA